MTFCNRCGNHAATKNFAGMAVCDGCATSLAWKFPHESVQGIGDLFDPYALGQDLVKSGTPLGPYGLGQEAGHAMKNAPEAMKNVGNAVHDAAKTVRIVAICAAGLGLGIIGLVVWNAHRTQKRALQFVEQHPQVLAGIP